MITKLRPICIPMPPGVVFYNGAIGEPCDTLDGPCCCGATHHWSEWADRFGVRELLIEDCNHEPKPVCEIAAFYEGLELL